MTEHMRTFPPTRHAALDRLQKFVPHAGRTYAGRRNFDLGPGKHDGVSQLSPYLRARLISEDEVLRATLAQHSPQAAEKFIQEVIWRGYWKGWLEHRPGVWTGYTAGLQQLHNMVMTQSGLRARWEEACLGKTGIAPFDAWASELAETGYLHNHARMWFASIWIYTLELPWELGADFFMRHLLDGDPASNTLGWRWVAGLHTEGKTYRADPENIAKYTQNRFGQVSGLAPFAAPVDGMRNPERTPPRPANMLPDPSRAGRVGLILHGEDLMPAHILEKIAPIATLPLEISPYSPWQASTEVNAWRGAALASAVTEMPYELGEVAPAAHDADAIQSWAEAHNLDCIVTAFAPVGPTAQALAQSSALQIRRPYDDAVWPHATHGFFRLKKKIPEILRHVDGRQLSLI